MGLKEEYLTEFEMQRDGTVPRSRVHLHRVIARYTTEQDLGNVDDSRTPHIYDIDEETRDRLIVHSREDAALAVVVASANEKRLVRLERLAWIGVLLAVAILLAPWF